MASSSSGFVAGLTVAAVAAVGFLAYQASASVPAGLGTPHAGDSPTTGAPKEPRASKNPAALPDDSGAGTRVVYALGRDRVWLVGPRDKVKRTFTVTPGSVNPAPGVYSVTSRSNAITGTDGTPVEHVVRFTEADGVAVGFSAAVDDPATDLQPNRKTGGIRESRADGTAMWRFAMIGVKVVVVRQGRR